MRQGHGVVYTAMLTARAHYAHPRGCVVRGGTLERRREADCGSDACRLTCVCLARATSHADPQTISDRHGVRCEGARPSHADSSAAYDRMMSGWVLCSLASLRVCRQKPRSWRAKTLRCSASWKLAWPQTARAHSASSCRQFVRARSLGMGSSASSKRRLWCSWIITCGAGGGMQAPC